MHMSLSLISGPVGIKILWKHLGLDEFAHCGIGHNSWKDQKERQTKICSLGQNLQNLLMKIVLGGGRGETKNAGGVGLPGPIIARTDFSVTPAL